MEIRTPTEIQQPTVSSLLKYPPPSRQVGILERLSCQMIKIRHRPTVLLNAATNPTSEKNELSPHPTTQTTTKTTHTRHRFCKVVCQPTNRHYKIFTNNKKTTWAHEQQKQTTRMATLARRIVSKNKRRIQISGYDLDMTCSYSHHFHCFFCFFFSMSGHSKYPHTFFWRAFFFLKCIQLQLRTLHTLHRYQQSNYCNGIPLCQNRVTLS